MPMAYAWRWMDAVIFASPLVVAQHTKTAGRDHGLNCPGDAIVMEVQGACETASGRSRGVDVELRHTRSGKNVQLHCRLPNG